MNARPAISLVLALGITTLLCGGAWFKVGVWLKEWRRPVGSGGLRPVKGSCNSNVDCPPTQACILDRTGRVFCRPDECQEDRDCNSGNVCRVVLGFSGEPGVHHCVLAGERREGERCADVPRNVREACQAGLLCTIVFCGRPCRLEEPANCPDGSVCVDGLNGPSCVPSCKGRQCPEEQSCIRYSSQISICSTVVGENCQEKPCPAGQECRYFFTNETEKIPMECSARCDGGRPCPEGFACDGYYCERPCSPAKPDCGPGRRCVRMDKEGTRYRCELQADPSVPI